MNLAFWRKKKPVYTRNPYTFSAPTIGPRGGSRYVGAWGDEDPADVSDVVSAGIDLVYTAVSATSQVDYSTSSPSCSSDSGSYSSDSGSSSGSSDSGSGSSDCGSSSGGE